MKRSRIGKTALLAAAVTLTASLSVGSALAYFTTYCTAKGSVTMNMGFTDTDIDEYVKNGKHIKIRNTGDYDCFVRVKAFAPDDVALSQEDTTKEHWTYNESDRYWYYNGVLSAEQETEELWIQYTLDANSAADEFNIIVVYECTPVIYDDNGNPYADWDNAVVLDDSTETVTEPDTGADTGTEQEGE